MFCRVYVLYQVMFHIKLCFVEYMFHIKLCSVEYMFHIKLCFVQYMFHIINKLCEVVKLNFTSFQRYTEWTRKKEALAAFSTNNTKRCH